jgi:glycosyltransferase involved in cell wall biosynthesis
MLRIALIANLPPPYRVPIYQRIAAMPDIALHVLFCCQREPNRQWDLPPLDFEHTFLRERFFTVDGRYIHNNPDVFSHLRRLAPDVVVINGFNPTHLYACLYAVFTQRVLVPMTDGTETSERNLTFLHRAVRHLVFARSEGFIAASRGGRQLYKSYGIPVERCHMSPLAADNQAYAIALPPAKTHDFIFSGRIEPSKNPLFALDVAVAAAKKLGRRTSILFVGAGSMEVLLRTAASRQRAYVDAHFSGFVMQGELPSLYHSARILLMPTRWDPWGMVVNEACAAGLPVIVSPAAGSAGELVQDRQNGYVSELNLELWSRQAVRLLKHPALYARYAQRSLELVTAYTFDIAAQGFAGACLAAHARVAHRREQALMARHPRVVIVERQLLQYRVALYQRLRALLSDHGVDLQLLIGDGTKAERQKLNQTSLDWSIQIPTHYFLREKICWQPFGRYARGADMVIVMHENKLLYNLWLLSFGRPRRLAFWGHGRNMQSNRPSGWKERFKRWTVNKVDWWFAYTDGSATLVNAAGFPRQRTTVVENAVDTRELVRFCEEVSARQVHAFRLRLRLGQGPVGLYLGSLYQEKRLDFLLNAARRIQERIPDFHLLVVGAGPEQGYIEAAASRHNWVHYLGPLQDRSNAEVLVVADVMLNPGLVGLGVLDSFVAGTPMFTTDCGIHSPEISYLESGVNGISTDDDVDLYAGQVVDILSDPQRLAVLKRGARASAQRYTIENMADRICKGVLDCLAN